MIKYFQNVDALFAAVFVRPRASVGKRRRGDTSLWNRFGSRHQ